MIAEDFTNSRLLFDPDLDLEEVRELPGKDSMTALSEALGRRGIVCSKLIQDSHGWCFRIYGDDARKYFVELIYVGTTNQASDWVLECARVAGFRFWEWEWSKAKYKAVGFEQRYFDLITALLNADHGFTRG
jgi:hypothetical protein